MNLKMHENIQEQKWLSMMKPTTPCLHNYNHYNQKVSIKISKRKCQAPPYSNIVKGNVIHATMRDKQSHNQKVHSYFIFIRIKIYYIYSQKKLVFCFLHYNLWSPWFGAIHKWMWLISHFAPTLLIQQCQKILNY